MITIVNPHDLGQLDGVKDTLEPLVTAILSHNWSPASYKDPNGRRVKANFNSIDMLVYDIDDGMTLGEASVALYDAKVEAIIGTSKSHQIQKKDQPPCDRFRILIPLSEDVMDEDTYKATWQHYKDKLFPSADEACKDVTRFYYPCKKIVHERNGEALEVIPYVALPKAPIVEKTGENLKRKLFNSTWTFLMEGALPGTFHKEFVKAAQNLRDAGYSISEAQAKLDDAAEKSDGLPLEVKYVDMLEGFYMKEPDLKYITKPIDSGITMPVAHSSSALTRTSPENIAKLVATSPFVTPNELLKASFEYLNDKELMQGEPTCFKGLNKLLSGGLKLGELSILCAEGKSGKSTLFDQLIVHYLDQGISCGYASREMRPAQEVLPHMFNIALGRNIYHDIITDEMQEEIGEKIKDWKLYFSQGMGAFPKEQFEAWLRALHAEGVNYFFVDHFHYCLNDPMDLSEITLFIQLIKKLVNELNVHIFLIVQPNSSHKYNDTGRLSMKGGVVFDQTLDNLFELTRLKGEDNKNVNILELVKKRKLTVKLGKIFIRYDEDTTLIHEVSKPKSNSLEHENSIKNGSGNYRNQFPKMPSISSRN